MSHTCSSPFEIHPMAGVVADESQTALDEEYDTAGIGEARKGVIPRLA